MDTNRFVCTIPAKDVSARAGPHLFRTYTVRENSTYNCKIWEASRATSAAPSYFKSIHIGPKGEEEEFIDAGIGHNNPVKQVHQEALRIFPQNRKISCIVSIGTGQTAPVVCDDTKLKNKFLHLSVIEAIAKVVTDCEKTAEEMELYFRDSKDQYFRFNVDRGLDQICLQEWDKLNEVRTYTNGYLRTSQVSTQIDKVVTALVASKKCKGNSKSIMVGSIGLGDTACM